MGEGGCSAKSIVSRADNRQWVECTGRVALELCIVRCASQPMPVPTTKIFLIGPAPPVQAQLRNVEAITKADLVRADSRSIKLTRNSGSD